MPDLPRFSVTVPAYNGQATLADTIESVRGQRFGDWELLIVDDGSVDATRSIADRFSAIDERIHVISQQNGGTANALNTAVRHARADLFVLLADDDLLLPDHLSAFDAFIRAHPEGSVFTSSGYFQYPGGRREPADPRRPWADPSACSLDELLVACFFGVGAVYRRATYDAVGGFVDGHYTEDYLFWLTALARGCRHRHLDRRLAVHRRSPTQKTANLVRTWESSVASIEALMATGLLTPTQIETAHRSISQLKHRIRAFRTVAGLLGTGRCTALMGRLRHLARASRRAGPSRP